MNRIEPENEDSKNLNSAINRYYKARGQFPKSKEIREDLKTLAYCLEEIYQESKDDPGWRNANRDAYNNEKDFLWERWSERFPEAGDYKLFDGQVVILGIPAFEFIQVAPAVHVPPPPVGEQEQPPPDPMVAPLALIPPPLEGEEGQEALPPIVHQRGESPKEKIARYSLLVAGVGLTASGIGGLANAGFKVAGAVAAKETAKKAAEAAAKQAAQQLAKKLALDALKVGSLGVVGAYAGARIIRDNGRPPAQLQIPGGIQP